MRRQEEDIGRRQYGERQSDSVAQSVIQFESLEDDRAIEEIDQERGDQHRERDK